MKILTIVGARPQFIKAAAVSLAFKKFPEINEVILHTGQHYDPGMSDVFFNDLQIPAPKYNLNLGGLSHGAMTGRMIEKIEETCLVEKPDMVLVYGDTNSTLAGVLAAKKIHIKTAHVEAGLRSFNMRMPEEINRILTDRISDFLFCPTQTAIDNLIKEGLDKGPSKIFNSGDVMFDAVKIFSEKSSPPAIDLKKGFVLCTIHRAENTDDPLRLSGILNALNQISEERQIVLPIHPRTKQIIQNKGVLVNDSISIIEPVSYFEMLYLLKHSALVMTDSGGLQKEAFFMEKPCITMRDETEWVELVEHGYNLLAGSSTNMIMESYLKSIATKREFTHSFYGKGNAGQLIASALLS